LESRPGEVARVWEKVGVIEHRILELALPVVLSHQASNSAPAGVNFT
jgi:hypothetical protein